MEKDLERILLPVDFKEASLQALDYASNLCIKNKGVLELLHVIETSGVLSEFFSSGDHLVKVTNRAKDKMLKLTKPIKEKLPGIKIKTRVERGKPYQKILDVAKQTQPGLLIMGENHQGKEVEKHLGRSVYHVTLHSTAPVLTLKGDALPNYDKIVVPLDLTKDIKRKLSSALFYGRYYKSDIYLVSALVGGIKMEDSRIYKRLTEARDALENNGVNCHIKLFDRSSVPPYQRVLQYVNKIEPDMIMIMTHQEGYTFDNYIGAFAHRIINDSPVPVLSLTSSVITKQYNRMIATMIDPAGVFTKSLPD